MKHSYPISFRLRWCCQRIGSIYFKNGVNYKTYYLTVPYPMIEIAYFKDWMTDPDSYDEEYWDEIPY